MFSKALLLTMATAAAAIELTPDNWDSATVGKSVFVKFFAPWCGHCKAMKPAWDSLMTEFESSEDVVVADVDCVGDGKPLCDKLGVKGFPTLKWGDPADLKDYKGGRKLEELKSFANSLTPPCNVVSLDNCSDQQVAAIESLKELSKIDLQGKVSAHEEEVGRIESTFQEELAKLQASYSELTSVKNKALAELAASSNINIVQNLLVGHAEAPSEEL